MKDLTKTTMDTRPVVEIVMIKTPLSIQELQN